MLAAQLYGAEDLRVEEISVPTIGEDEVLIRTRICGVCPSDVRFFKGISTPHGDPPVLLGHEWAGEVVETGKSVRRINIGDRVAVSWRDICGFCEHCRQGRSNFCDHMNVGRTLGGFAEFGKAHKSNVWVLPEEISYEEAAFAEPIACCLNGQEALNISAGDDVAVVGVGPIGLLHIELAKLVGARVIAIDIIQERLDIAKELGADVTVHAIGDSVSEKIRLQTDGRGVDKVIVAVGTHSALRTAFDIVGVCGSINIFAGIYPREPMLIDLNLIHYRQVSLSGSHDFTDAHFSRGLKLLKNKEIHVLPIVSHRFCIAEMENALRVVEKKQGLKVLVMP
jgi:L-iditol 2-dehydrogenase